MGDFCRACGTSGTRRNGLCWDCYKKPGQLELKHCPNCGGSELTSRSDGFPMCENCGDPLDEIQKANLRSHLESLRRLRGVN